MHSPAKLINHPAGSGGRDAASHTRTPHSAVPVLRASCPWSTGARASHIQAAGPANHRIDRVVLIHPGYTIAVTADGGVRVDFTLNEIGVRRQEIESRYLLYPSEQFRRVRVDRGRVMYCLPSCDLRSLPRSGPSTSLPPERSPTPGTASSWP